MTVSMNIAGGHLPTKQGHRPKFAVKFSGDRSRPLTILGEGSARRTANAALPRAGRFLYPIVRSLIQTWQREDLSRKSIKNLFGIVRAIYNFQLDEMAQCGRPVVSPWLVKWKKVAPPKTVQRELPYFTVAQMAAIVKGAKTQLNRALFALAAGSGARAGELFALRVESDVNLNERTITIRRSVFEGKRTPRKATRVTRTEPVRCLGACFRNQTH